jgi:hypothetical protein
MISAGENRRARRKTCPSVTLSTTNPTWIDPGANPGLYGERPESLFNIILKSKNATDSYTSSILLNKFKKCFMIRSWHSF